MGHTYTSLSLSDLAIIRKNMLRLYDNDKLSDFVEYGSKISMTLQEKIYKDTPYDIYSVKLFDVEDLFLIKDYSTSMFVGDLIVKDGERQYSINIHLADKSYCAKNGMRKFKGIIPYKYDNLHWINISKHVDMSYVGQLLYLICMSVNKNLSDNFLIFHLHEGCNGAKLYLEKSCFNSNYIYSSELSRLVYEAEKGKAVSNVVNDEVLKGVIDIFGDNVKEVYFVMIGNIENVYARKNDDGEMTITIM